MAGGAPETMDTMENGDGNHTGIIEEILRLQAEYLEKLPHPILSYELTRARALAHSKLTFE